MLSILLKLDDDFLINLSVEKIDNKLSGQLKIRSLNKGIAVSIGERLEKL